MAPPRKDVGPRPLCECHGVEMVCPSRWRCPVKKLEYDYRYQSTPRGQAALRTCYLNSAVKSWAASMSYIEKELS